MAVVSKVTKSGASAFQGTHSDGSQVVAIKDIRVVIYPNPNGKRWLAQGFEIDYVAQGKNVKDVQRAFEEGLAGTIHAYIEAHGNIKGILRAAPVRVRLKALEHAFKASGVVAKFSQLSVHDLKLRIEYMALPTAA